MSEETPRTAKPALQPASAPAQPGKPPMPPPRTSLLPWLLAASALLGLALWQLSSLNIRQSTVDYSAFYQWLQAGKVRSVVIKSSWLEFELNEPERPLDKASTSFRTSRPEGDTTLIPALLERNVRFRAAAEEQTLPVQIMLDLAPWLLLLAAAVWLTRRTQRAMTLSGGPLGAVLEPKSHKFEKSQAVNVTFDDVAGLTSAKRDLQEVVLFLKEPERYRRLGAKVPRGVLLVGPPGTGKTLLARAVAGESGVPFFSITASEFIELFVGVGAARVRELFASARQSAPAIIFIDELDAVGRSRGAGFGGGHDEREQTLNQLLSEMDGFSRNDQTIVLAATNRPDVLDPALLRPGRFDRHVTVDRPELSARRAILQVHTRGKPLAKDVDLNRVARNTPGFSGADLANLVNEAALRATRLGANEIAAADFLDAYDKIVLGDPQEAKLGPEERRRVAAHESGHAIAAQFSASTEPPQRVSILPRGATLGATQQTPAEDRHLATELQLEARLRVLMGGYAAERLVFGSVSSGAENDLREATQLASKMVAHYGMSPSLGPAYYEHDVEHPFLGRRIATEGGLSDETIHTIEAEARNLLARALEQTLGLLTAHRRELDRLMEALLEKETMEGDALTQLLSTPASAPSTALARLAVAR